MMQIHVYFYYECGAKIHYRARPNLNQTKPNKHQPNLSLTLIFIIKAKLRYRERKSSATNNVK